MPGYSHVNLYNTTWNLTIRSLQFTIFILTFHKHKHSKHSAFSHTIFSVIVLLVNLISFSVNDCPPLTNPSNGSLVESIHLCGHKTEARCNAGYRFPSHTRIMYLECQQHGQWNITLDDGRIPDCQGIKEEETKETITFILTTVLLYHVRHVEFH